MKRAAALFLVLRIVGAAMTYVFIVIAARITTIEDFGILVSILSAGLFVAAIASVGQQQALIRHLPPMLMNANYEMALSLVRTSLLVVLKASFILWSVLSVGAILIGTIHGNPIFMVLPIGFLLFPLMAVADFQAHLARAYRIIPLTVLPKDILWRAASLLFLLSISAAIAAPIPLWLMFVTLTVVLALIIGFSCVFGARMYGMPSMVQLLTAPTGGFDVVRWKDSNNAFWIMSVTSVVFASIDVVIVGIMIGPEAAALYFAASRIAQAVNFIEQSYSVIIGPIFAEHASSGRKELLNKAALQGTSQSFWPTLFLAVAAGFFSTAILSMFGPEFAEADNILLILLIAAVLNVAFGPADILLAMSGHEASCMRIGLISTVIGVFVICIGAFFWQNTGAALACLHGIALRKAWFSHEAKARLGMRTDILTVTWERFKSR